MSLEKQKLKNNLTTNPGEPSVMASETQSKIESQLKKNQINVSAQASYIASESNPESCRFFFAYKMKILNQGKLPAQLMSRHWIITDGAGHVEEIRGAGVIGTQPRILPGQHFEYESACPLTTASGSMKGYYQMVLEDGESFDVEIPEFYLIAPSALH